MIKNIGFSYRVLKGFFFRVRFCKQNPKSQRLFALTGFASQNTNVRVREPKAPKGSALWKPVCCKM
ncbi:MAG: hypothetical protein LUD03_03925, partial [Firmicutes bacterium]|nr:hypothetical protein [Bacillota bacterium]